MIPVTMGVVVRMALNTAIARKPKLQSHIFLSFLGHFLFRPKGLPSLLFMNAFRCSHSAGAGIGHMVHQILEPNGSKMDIRKNHQTIHTKMTEKFFAPDGVPKNALNMIITKKKRFGTIKTY